MLRARVDDNRMGMARGRCPVRRSLTTGIGLVLVTLALLLVACRKEETKKSETAPKFVVQAEPVAKTGPQDKRADPSASLPPEGPEQPPSPQFRSGQAGPVEGGAGGADESVPSTSLGAGGSDRPTPPEPRAPNPEPRTPNPAFFPDFATLYERAAPSVVKVETFGGGEDAPFAMGTGFFFGAPGEIITNAHVVRNGQRFQITTADGRELPARLQGADEHTDIALLLVSGDSLPSPLLPAAPDAVRPGDWVLAIGNPLGLDFSASRGIVSALNRTDVLPDSLGYWDFIQTDAAINVGNSGGPLLDVSGSVVGIAAAIEKQADRIGFAIPIATATVVADHLRRFGMLKRAWLGIEIVEVKGQVQVYGVHPESPAGRAGLQPGDVILAIDGTPVSDRARFRWQVATHPLATPARFKVLRNGAEREVSVQLEAAPDLQRVEG